MGTIVRDLIDDGFTDPNSDVGQSYLSAHTSFMSTKLSRKEALIVRVFLGFGPW